MGAPNRTLSSSSENQGGRTGMGRLWGSEDDPKLMLPPRKKCRMKRREARWLGMKKPKGPGPLPAIWSTPRVTRSPKAIRLIACAGRDVRLAV